MAAYRAPIGPDPLASLGAGQGILGNWNPQYMAGAQQGILGGVAPPSSIGSAPPTLPASSFSSFMTGDPDPSLVTGGAAALAGNNGGLGPLTTGQKWQMALSGVQDATDALQHRQGGNFEQTRNDILSQGQRGVRAQALSDYQTAQTPQDKQGALMRFWASGGDTAGLGAVLKSQNPELRDIPENGTLAVIGTDGLPSSLIHGTATPKPPQTRNIQRGMNNVTQQYNPSTMQWEDVAGAVGPKFKPAAAAKAAAPGAINIPHPSGGY